MTKSSHDNSLFIPAFMASGIFCFAVGVYFMLAILTGGDMAEPFALMTSLICR